MEQQRWQVSSPQVLEFDDVRALKVGIIAGRVDILVHDDPVSRVEVSEVEGQPIELTLKEGVLEVVHSSNTSRGWLNFRDVVISGRPREVSVISIAVPSGTSVALRTVSGDGLACGSTDTTLDTVSGSVMADDTNGELKVSTVSGEAIVRHHSGTLEARTVSGEVTASGYCDSVRTNSVSGSISLDLLGDPQQLDARTVSGDLTVRVSPEVGVEVSTASISGSLVINNHRFSGRGRQSHHFEPGSTDAKLQMRANSVSGNVAILHRHPDTVPVTEDRNTGSAHTGDGAQ